MGAETGDRKSKIFRRKLLKIFAILFQLMLVGLFIYTVSVMEIAGSCRTFLQKAVPSSDGEYVAALTVSGCGATTHNSYHITILKRGEDISALNRPGPNGVVFSENDYYDGSFRWVGPRELEISYRDKYPRWNNKEVYSVKVRYKRTSGDVGVDSK